MNEYDDIKLATEKLYSEVRNMITEVVKDPSKMDRVVQRIVLRVERVVLEEGGS